MQVYEDATPVLFQGERGYEGLLEFLTNEGVEYLRDYLHLPADIVPATMKKSASEVAAEAAGGEAKGSDGNWGGEGEYRRDGGLGRGGGRFSDRSSR